MGTFSSLGSRAEYHSCLFTAISLDAEWTRRSHYDGQCPPKAAIEDAFKAISLRCTKYKQRVSKNNEDQKLPPASPTTQALWDCAYQPLEYVPLGHDDALSLVLFDDFDPFVSVTGQCPTTVEEMAVGYLPKLESLTLEWPPEEEKYIQRARCAFGNPTEIFNPNAKRSALLVFSRFKVNGLGSLGMGTLHHVALMRALVRCIGQTLTDMESAVSGGEQQALMQAFEIEKIMGQDGVATVDDLGDTRFMMVDLLGQEELGIVYFVSNWSIAAALNSRIQCLKFEDVLAADASGGRLEAECESSEWMDALCSFYSDIQGNEGKEALSAKGPRSEEAHKELLTKIRHAHPLRWARSTPAVRKDLFYQDVTAVARPEVRGWIDATTHLRIAPGHQSKAQALTEAVAKRYVDKNKSRSMASVFATCPGLTIGPEDFTIHQLGASDLALPHVDLQPYDPNRLLPVRDFLVQMYELMAAAGGDDMRKGEGSGVAAPPDSLDPATSAPQQDIAKKRNGRHIVGATTFCGIPVPALKIPGPNGDKTLLCPQFEPGKHVAVLELILPVLKRRIMLAPRRVSTLLPDSTDEALYKEWLEWHQQLDQHALQDGSTQNDFFWGALATTNIYNEARTYGLPQTLIRTLEFVYHNFTTLLANPLAFDSVLDLYDVFASFHRVLTRELPRICAQPPEKSRTGKAAARAPEETEPIPLDKKRVDMIARLIDAVHRSLGHRMYRLFPENSHRDMDIDFRGGLNALVYCADGILKLGVGVLRHHVLKEAVDDRARVGVVTRIGFRQGIYAIALRLQVESKARLGIVDTDVPHLYHLPSYVDFLHEAFHMVYNAARNPDPKDRVAPMLPTVPRDSGDLTIDGRLAEVFANLLTALFVCQDKPERLAEHMVIQYAIRNMNETDQETLGNLIELTCVLYIVCGSITHLKALAEREGRAPWWHCQNDGKDGKLIENGELDLIQKFRRRINDHNAENAINAVNFSTFFFDHLPFFSTKVAAWRHRVPELELQVKLVFDAVYEKLLRPFVPIVVAKACLIFSRYWFRASGRLINDKTYRDCVMQNLNDNDAPVSKEELSRLLSAWEAMQEDLEKETSSIIGADSSAQGVYKPFSFLTWRSDDGEGRLDPMIVLGFLLNKILSCRSNDMLGADRQGPYHLPTKAGAPCFDKDFKVHDSPEQRPRVFIQRGVSALFSSDLNYRAHRLGSRITMLKMFGDMAARLRSKRFSEMLNRNVSVKMTRLLSVLKQYGEARYADLVNFFDPAGNVSLPPEQWYEECKKRGIFAPPTRKSTAPAMPACTQETPPLAAVRYFELKDMVSKMLHELDADPQLHGKISTALAAASLHS